MQSNESRLRSYLSYLNACSHDMKCPVTPVSSVQCPGRRSLQSWLGSGGYPPRLLTGSGRREGRSLKISRLTMNANVKAGDL